MTVDYCVISIGALSHNRLWGEGAPTRTAHATTTLVSDAERTILVDPSLPAVALAARLDERTGKRLSQVTDVFCTTLRPVHRRSIEALPEARWWCSQAELEIYGNHLEALRDSAERLDAEDAERIETELRLIERFQPAPDRFSEQIQLIPLPGPTGGSAGLVLAPPTRTLIIAGDAAVTREHVLRGQVWAGCTDTEAAMDSMRDILEIADVIIPGHDNVILSPQRWR